MSGLDVTSYLFVPQYFWKANLMGPVEDKLGTASLGSQSSHVRGLCKWLLSACRSAGDERHD